MLRSQEEAYRDKLINAAYANDASTINYIIMQLRSLELRDEANYIGKIVNAGDQDGNTPLICAARRGNIGALKALIMVANVNTQNLNTGWTALHVAASRGEVATVKCLLAVRGIDLSIRSNLRRTAAEEAKFYSRLETSRDHMEVYRLITAAERVRAVRAPVMTAAAAAASSAPVPAPVPVPESYSDEELLVQMVQLASMRESIDSSFASSPSSASVKAASPAELSLQQQLDEIGFDGKIPLYFQDPVTQELLDADCIAVSSGYAISRSVLRKWFEEKRMPATVPCPLTNKPIHKSELNNAFLYPLSDALLDFVRQAKESKAKQEQENAAAAASSLSAASGACQQEAEISDAEKTGAARLGMFGAALPASSASAPSAPASASFVDVQNDAREVDDSRNRQYGL